MRKLIAGLLLGGAIGAWLARRFAGDTGLRKRLRAHWDASMQAGRDAGARRRAEMEAEYARMTGQDPPE